MKTLTNNFYWLIRKNIKFYKNYLFGIVLIQILLTFVLSGLVTASYAQSPWTKKTDMSTARMNLSSIPLDGKIYVIGGTDSSRYKNWGWGFNTVEMYDPILDSWEVKAPMATVRVNFATCILNGKILAVGGSRHFYKADLKSIEEYDPVSNTWTHKTDMPRARTGPTASLVNGKIYIIGGGDEDFETIAENDVYDTLTHTWTAIADIPTPRMSLQAVVLNGKIYAIGGVTGMSDGEVSLTTVEEYDPATDTWAAKADMNYPRKYFDACALNGKIYVFGGCTGNCAGVLSSVEEYDPATDTWKEMNNLPAAIGGPSVAQLNGKAYVIGGDVYVPNPCNPIVVSTIYEYNPDYDLYPLIEKTEVDKSCVKAGVDSVFITTKMRDPTGITLLVEIEAPDQTPVDSLQLFDDGNHNDENAGDSLYANVWPVSSAEEHHYYLDIEVTKIETDTLIHHINNIATFLTDSLVTFKDYSFASNDIEPNPGDHIRLEITLKNNSSISTAKSIEAKLISLDTLVSASNYSLAFGDIAAGENATSSGKFMLSISDECPVNTQIPILVDIMSDGFKYWSDTFSILVQEPSNIEEIIEPLTRIYPNPANNILNIEISNSEKKVLEIEILTVTGAIIYRKEYNNMSAHYTEQIDLSQYKKGVYLIKVKQHNAIYTGKVIVK